MMQIFHNNAESLCVPAGEHWKVIDVWTQISGVKTVILEAGAKLDYLVVSDNSSMKVELVHHDEASSRVSGIVLGENVSTTLDVESNLMGDRAVSNLHLVAYLIQGSKVTLNGNVRIQPDLQDCEGHLLQENLVLGKNIEIKTLPQLDIRSHNVRASHGARIEGMDEKKLFYLMSRGISLGEAKRLLIDGSLHQLFQHLDDERSGVLKNDLLERIVKG